MMIKAKINGVSYKLCGSEKNVDAYIYGSNLSLTEETSGTGKWATIVFSGDKVYLTKANTSVMERNITDWAIGNLIDLDKVVNYLVETMKKAINYLKKYSSNLYERFLDSEWCENLHYGSDTCICLSNGKKNMNIRFRADTNSNGEINYYADFEKKFDTFMKSIDLQSDDTSLDDIYEFVYKYFEK